MESVLFFVLLTEVSHAVILDTSCNRKRQIQSLLCVLLIYFSSLRDTGERSLR